MSHNIGNQGAIAHVIAAHDCDSADDIVHEVSHTLGMFHEQARVDRDDYIIVHEDRISDTREINYTIYTNRGFTNSKDYGPFDFESNMIYSSWHSEDCPEPANWPTVPGQPCMEKLVYDSPEDRCWHSTGDLSATDLYAMARRYTASWFRLAREGYGTTPQYLLRLFGDFDRTQSMAPAVLAVGKFCDDPASSNINNDDVLVYNPTAHNWYVQCDGGDAVTLHNTDAYPFPSVGLANVYNAAGEDEPFTDILINDSGTNRWKVSSGGSGGWTWWNNYVTDDIATVGFGVFCSSSEAEGVQDAVRLDPDFSHWDVSCLASEDWHDLTGAVWTFSPTTVDIADVNGDGYSDVLKVYDTTSMELAFGGPSGSSYTPYTFYPVDHTIWDAGFSMDDIYMADYDGDAKADFAYLYRHATGDWEIRVHSDAIFSTSPNDSVVFQELEIYDLGEYQTLADLDDDEISMIVGDFVNVGTTANRADIVLRIEEDIQ
jgi:hypothetical protein